MYYPLENFKNFTISFRFGEIYPAGYGSLTGQPHLGVDVLCPKFERVIAPTDGSIVQKVFGQQGGNTIHFLDKYGHLWRFLHLEMFSDLYGNVKEGDIIGYTGSSQTATPHLHFDVSKGSNLILNIDNFLDPLIYIKQYDKKDMWDNALIEYKKKFTDPKVIPIIKQVNGTTRLDLLIKRKDGSIEEKQNVSLNEWTQNAVGIFQ
jgi:murein DD-endopeptidase MepM/ murein hydrolase activator NlpD